MADDIGPRADETGRATPASRGRCGVIGVTLLLGSALLAATLRVPRGSGSFVILGVVLAATWIVGAALAGPFPLVPRRWPRPARSLLVAVAVGGIAYAVFLAAFQLGRHLPLVSGDLGTVLPNAGAGRSGLVLFVALVNGIAEELFFRGALLSAVARGDPVIVTTAAYVVVTAATGNVALIVAAAVMGTIFSLERVATRGVAASIVTHMTWSALMLLALPR
jgi:uncharacterized protein